MYQASRFIRFDARLAEYLYDILKTGIYGDDPNHLFEVALMEFIQERMPHLVTPKNKFVIGTDRDALGIAECMDVNVIEKPDTAGSE